MFQFSVAPAQRGPRVCLWPDPDGYAIDVLDAPDAGRSVVRIYYDRNFVPPMQKREMTVPFECEVETETLSSALLAGLRGLFESPHAVALNDWRHESLKGYLDRFDSAQSLRQPPGAG